MNTHTPEQKHAYYAWKKLSRWDKDYRNLIALKKSRQNTTNGDPNSRAFKRRATRDVRRKLKRMGIDGISNSI